MYFLASGCGVKRVARTQDESDAERRRGAIAATGQPTEQSTGHPARDLLDKIEAQECIRQAFGKLPRDDDREVMRLDRPGMEQAGD